MSTSSTLSDSSGMSVSLPDCKLVESSASLVQQLSFDPNLSLKAGSIALPSSTALIRANLANHLLAQQAQHVQPVQPVVTSVHVVLRTNPVNVSSLARTSSVDVGMAVAPSTAVTFAGPFVRLPLSTVLPAADNSQNPNATSLVCVVTPPAARASLPQMHQLPLMASVDARPNISGLHALIPQQMPKSITVERPRIPMTMNRQQIIVQGVVANNTLISPTGGRTVIPARLASAAAVPVVGASAASVAARTSVSTGVGVPNTAAIQIAFRAPHDTLIPPAVVTPTGTRTVVSSALHLQPKSSPAIDTTTKYDLMVRPTYRQRAPVIIPTTTVIAAASHTTVSQTQAVNLTTKTKILLTSAPPKSAPVASVSLPGPMMALNLSQSARPRLGAVTPTASSAISSHTPVTHSTTAKTVVTAASVIPASISTPVSTSTASRYQRQPVAISYNPRSKVPSVVVAPNTSTFQPLPVVSSTSNTPAVSPLSFTMEHRAIQPHNAGVSAVYRPHILTVPAKITLDQSVAILGGAITQTPHALGQTTLVPSSSASVNNKLGHVIVTMDASRRTMLSLQQQYLTDGTLTSTSTSHPHLQTTLVPSDAAAAVNLSVITSPRPSILRKRPHEATTPKKTNLTAALNACATNVATLKHDVSVATSVTASPFKAVPQVNDAIRESSQSSTDTASSSGSTPRSCPPSGEKIKPELLEAVENGIIANGHAEAPRKKPRKQSLHCNEEMPAAGFTSGEEDDKKPEIEEAFVRLKPRKHLEKPKESYLPAEVCEYHDEEGIRFSLDDSQRRFPGGIVGSQPCALKSRNNHFVSYNDLIVKEERRQTVIDLSNSRRALQRGNGWTLYQIADHFKQLHDLEQDVLSSVLSIVPSTHPTTRLRSAVVPEPTDDNDSHRVQELVLGNIQRCRQYMDRLGEVRAGVINLVSSHQPRISDIVSRHQIKRTVRKKERA